MDVERRKRLEDTTRYEPSEVEGRILERWLDGGYFHPDAEGSPDENFSIAIPPPNVTGALHMGHALNGTVQDVLTRLNRMRGRNSLWALGLDHAGIATQAVVERELGEEGISRRDIGREAFVERVWQWREQYGSTIIEQFKRLGASCDYDRERFTLDEGYVRAVVRVFVALYDKGYVYRDNYIVNWDPGSRSAISDLEVENREVEDTLYYIDYPLEGSERVLTVATVRPETMLADAAVAVNPDDERYGDLVGEHCILPLVGRRLPVIADEHVDPEFGTGALKITPGHDPNDFEIGRANGLDEIVVIGEDGLMNAQAGERVAGLSVEEAREAVVAALREEGRLRDEEPYLHSVPYSHRSGHRVEPLISLQWFCRMDELAKPAIEVVERGQVSFVPERFARVYLEWMHGLRPWVLSRQLWWGHRLPVWYCDACEETYVAESPPERCGACGGELRQEEDVLDTWFSSALWPFAVLGWPDDTPELAAFYPTDTLVTARDIIFLWVARMVMMGLEFAGDIPFSDVYITSIIQAADGRRMSKSLGTGINPLDLIEQFGADGTRYGLLKMSSTQDVRFSAGMLDEGAKLANKLWNAARFVLLQTDPEAEPAPLATTAEDRWILSRLAGTIDDVLGQLDAYDFAAAVKGLYGFIWNDFCDWYVEAAKARLYGEDEAARRQVSATLVWVLERTVALAHPVMPFVTEEIWGFLPGERAMLLVSPVPEPQLDHRDPALEESARNDMEVVSEARRLAGEGERPLVTAAPGSLFMALLERAKGVAVEHDAAAGAAVVVARGDRESLEAKLKAAVAEHERAQSKLANEGFLARAPAQLVDAEREKAERFAGEVSDIQRRLEAL